MTEIGHLKVKPFLWPFRYGDRELLDKGQNHKILPNIPILTNNHGRTKQRRVFLRRLSFWNFYNHIVCRANLLHRGHISLYSWPSFYSNRFHGGNSNKIKWAFVNK